MSDKPAEAAAAPPKKSKKLLIILAVLLVALALAAGGAWFYVSKQRAAALEGEDEAPVAKVEQISPPTYLPLDNMVVNLADPGGEKVAQIGVTLELADSKAVDKVKQYLPTIRSGVLLLVSQRSSEELLQIEGKEKLAADILLVASRPFGGVPQADAADTEKTPAASKKPKPPKKDKPQEEPPVRRVLFSSFIVQ